MTQPPRHAIYFYHTQDIQHILHRMQQHEFPPHFLYGASKLADHGIRVIWHPSRIGLGRLRMMMRNTLHIIRHISRIDAVYATHYQGLEPIIFLRALHLFPRPIIIWHHQPVIKARPKYREWLGRIFYKGIDRMFFFSEKLRNESLATGKVTPKQAIVGHWGADIDFYDRITATPTQRTGFISTGKEMRDLETLIAAFNHTGLPIDIYINHKNGDIDYDSIISKAQPSPNISIHYTDRLQPYELAQEVNRHACVVICCQETKYTVGLTTVVEALAMGLPIICSHNPQIPIDIQGSGCGLHVPYYDTEGWIKAINRMHQNPEEAQEMGRKAKAIATQTYNDVICAAEVAQAIKDTIAKD